MTDSAKLPALAVTDRWMRGVYYSRQFQLFNGDGTAMDLSSFGTITPALSGSSGRSVPTSELRLVIDDAATGRITVGALPSALELDWPQSGLGPRNQVLISVAGQARPLLQLRLTIEDSAFA